MEYLVMMLDQTLGLEVYGEMVRTRRNLAPVLGADRATGRERSSDGGPNLILADVIVSAQSHVMPRNARNKPARAVGACATGKPPVLGQGMCGGGTARDAAPLQGVQLQLRSYTSTVCSQ